MTPNQTTAVSAPISVAVVGAGYMGRGIAHTLARGGATVVVTDSDEETSLRAHATMLREVDDAEREGLLDPGAGALVRKRSRAGGSLQDAVDGAALVVEAVFEDVAVKHAVLGSIDAIAAPEVVIATNTSAIPVRVLATALARPERFFGIHWFNPAPYLPGIEIIVGPQSDPELLPRVIELLRRAGKHPALVEDTAGFVANRLQFALFKEAALMVEEGLSTPERIDEVVRSSFGFRLPFFGPFAIADMAGLDVYSAAYASLEAGLGERFAIPPSLAARVADGDFGTKTGGGYRAFDPADVARMTATRDRSYVALARLRAEIEAEASDPE